MSGTTAEYHMVCFIDLLGLSNELKDIRAMPNPNTTQGKIQIQKMENAFNKILNFRNAFMGYHAEFQTRHIPKGKSNDDVDVFLQITDLSKLNYQSFSDSIIITLCLNKSSNPVPCLGIYATLASCMCLFFSSMLEDYPFRGGIEVGPAFKIDPSGNEILGSPSVNAYLLEEKHADFPRIVVGEGLINFLHTVDTSQPSDFPNEASYNANLINRNNCLELLATDKDGTYFIDYLSNGGKKHVPENEFKLLCQEVYEKINNNYKKFISEGNLHVANKYKKLMEYFDSRKDIWT